jgi:hypothetical protein
MLNVQSDAIAKTIMLAKKGHWLHAAIAAITAASLSLSVMSVAQAQGGERTPRLKGIYNTTQDPAKRGWKEVIAETWTFHFPSKPASD